MTDTLPFSEEKQWAFIGHMLTNKRFFEQSIAFAFSDWFINPVASKVFVLISNFHKTYNRQPSSKEIVNSGGFDKEEKELREKFPEIVNKSIKLLDTIGLDVIKSEIDSWHSMITLKKTLKQAMFEYNAGNMSKGWSILDTGCIKKSASSFDKGSAPVFAPAPTRAIEEKYERLDQSKHILQYGIKYLDDALGGIIPNDLVFIGAKSGIGKTSLANSISRYNASRGYPVHYFALEAENGEIERRIKFSIMSELFYQKTPKDLQPPIGAINYVDWRLGRIEPLLAPFENEAIDVFNKQLKTLHTLYRTSGEFGLDALDRHLSAIGKESSLIVIDHIHYIDIDGENENRAYKDITKKIRDSCLANGVPVIVIAHLRKEQSGVRAKSIVPSMEDFHGSSDLFKIATTAIMMSPAHDEVKDAPHLWPTYIRPVKSRLEGVRTRYTGIVNFNVKSNIYEAPYRIGRLVSAETEWQELEGMEVPYWAKNKDTK